MNIEERIKEVRNNPKLSEREKLIKERDLLREALENKKIKDEIKTLRYQIYGYNLSNEGILSRNPTKSTVLTEESLDQLIEKLFGGR